MFNTRSICTATLLLLSASALAPLAARAESSPTMGTFETFLTELVSKIGKPKLELDFEIDSESGQPFGLTHLDADISVPLKDTVSLPLGGDPSKPQDAPLIALGDSAGIIVVLSVEKGLVSDPLTGALSFQTKDGKPASLPLSFRVKNFDPIKFRVDGISLKSPSANTNFDQIQVSGSCELEQETVNFANLASGGAPIAWKPVKTCSYTFGYDPKAGKFTYKFAFNNKP